MLSDRLIQESLKSAYVHKFIVTLLIGVLFFTSCSSGSGSSSPSDGNNSAPTANAGADKNVEVNQVVTITGSGTDIDGTIASYEWTKGTTVLATTASFDYIPIAVGTDTLILTVMDNDGATDSDSMDVTVTKTPTHKANISVIYASASKIAQIKWDERYYQDSDGYVVEKRIDIQLNKTANSDWTEISRLSPGASDYAIQDSTSVPTSYRIVSISDQVLLSGENDATQLLVDPALTSSIYFTQGDVNISMPLNRIVTVNTLSNSNNIQKVTYYMDTIRIGESGVNPNFPLNIDTSRYTNGNHRLDHELKVDDASYVIFNTPIATNNTNLSLSLSLKAQTGLIPVVAHATSKEKIDGVKFYLDEILMAYITEKNYCSDRYGCGDNNDSYMWGWNSENYSPQTYTIKAEVSDAGGEYLSKEITHDLNNPPVLNVNSPIADSVVGNTLIINGTVLDDQNNTTVTIKIGNVAIYSSTDTTFSTSYNMSDLPEKIYTIEIKATDPDNKSTIIIRNVLYKVDSDLTAWKILGKENTLQKINSGYLVSQNGDILNKLNISTDITTSNNLDIVRDNRISYLDIQNSGKSVFYGNTELRVSQIFLAENDLSIIGEGQHPILNDDYSLWISSYYNKMYLYSFDTGTALAVEKPTDSKYWLNWSYYLQDDQYFCASANMSSSPSNYDVYIYDIVNNSLTRTTNTTDTVEMCQGIDSYRMIYGEYNSSPNKLYYSDLNNLGVKIELSSNFSTAKLIDGLMSWVDKDDNALYVLHSNETVPTKIAEDAYLREVKDRVLTYTKDSKLYLYKNGISSEIWPVGDSHYIDNGYIYIIRGPEQLIYRLSI